MKLFEPFLTTDPRVWHTRMANVCIKNIRVCLENPQINQRRLTYDLVALIYHTLLIAFHSIVRRYNHPIDPPNTDTRLLIEALKNSSAPDEVPLKKAFLQRIWTSSVSGLEFKWLKSCRNFTVTDDERISPP